MVGIGVIKKIEAEQMIPFFDLKRQHALIKNELQEAIEKVVAEGRFILGKEVELFEKEFAKYCNSKYGVGVNSGSDAILLSLKAIGLKPKDKVIIAPNTAPPAIMQIINLHAEPVFVDIDEETYCINPKLLGERMNKKIKAVIATHLYGHPADMNPILKLKEKYNFKLIEDCSHAHGAEYRGKKVGCFGDTSCFSLYPTKNLGALGDAGIVLTKDEKIAERIRTLKENGNLDFFPNKEIRFNSKIDELQAAILRVKLKHLNEWNENRRKNAKLYEGLIKNNELIFPIEKDYARHVYHLFAVRHKKRDELKRFLEKKGIKTKIHYANFVKGKNLEISNKIMNEIISLPMFPELRKEEIEFICNAINDFK